MKGATNAMTIGGTVGSDTKPIKIVDGQAVAVTNDLAVDSEVIHKSGNQTLIGSLSFGNDANGKIDGYVEGSGGSVVALDSKNAVGYTLRLVVVMQNNNIGKLLLQRLGPQGQWQAETVVGTLQ